MKACASGSLAGSKTRCGMPLRVRKLRSRAMSGDEGAPISTGPPAPISIRPTRRRISARMISSPRSASATSSARNCSGTTRSASTAPAATPSASARRPESCPISPENPPAESSAMSRSCPCPSRPVMRSVPESTTNMPGLVFPGMFVVLSGTLRITGRDGHGHDLLIAELSAGGFSGEIGQLSGRRALADGVAAGAVEALLVVPEQLRALLVAEADLGEEIMRALILRRVGLIEMGAGGPVLIGAPSSPDMARLRNFLARNGIPHLVFDPANDPDAHAFIERYAPKPEDMPLVACPDGSVLRNPGENELAKCIGMLDAADAERVHDVAVVGAGPAGLATAVYAASEGLSVLVVDARSFGGQAGASARIENYLGFPTGI